MEIRLSNIRTVERTVESAAGYIPDQQTGAHSRPPASKFRAPKANAKKAREQTSGVPSFQEYLRRAGFPQGSRVAFQVDSGTGETFIEVVDGGTDEVLRRIPPEEFRNMMRIMGESTGIMTDKQV